MEGPSEINKLFSDLLREGFSITVGPTMQVVIADGSVVTGSSKGDPLYDIEIQYLGTTVLGFHGTVTQLTEAITETKIDVAKLRRDEEMRQTIFGSY